MLIKKMSNQVGGVSSPSFQRMEPVLSLLAPQLGTPSPSPHPVLRSPAYITAGAPVSAGWQAFLLNFQELLGSGGGGWGKKGGHVMSL